MGCLGCVAYICAYVLIMCRLLVFLWVMSNVFHHNGLIGSADVADYQNMLVLLVMLVALIILAMMATLVTSPTLIRLAENDMDKRLNMIDRAQFLFTDDFPMPNDSQ